MSATRTPDDHPKTTAENDVVDPTHYGRWFLIGLGLIGLSLLLDELVPHSGESGFRNRFVGAGAGFGFLIWCELLLRAWRNRA